MFKILHVLGLISLLALLFTGCTPREVSLEPSQHVVVKHDANDIDISDLDKHVVEHKPSPMKKKNGKVSRVKFPMHEYASLQRMGKATIKGKIYLKDLYGAPVFGSGTRLYLNPVTSYSRQWYKESYIGGAKMQKADARLFNYLRFTAADDNGNFAFYGVPSGSYYLIGKVECAEECGFDSRKSIRIASKISIHGNQILQKDLVRAVK